MNLHEPRWKNWWALLDQIGQHPKWVRSISIRKNDPHVGDQFIRHFVGRDWITLAVERIQPDRVLIYGYLEGDQPLLTHEKRPAFDTEPPPPWLVGIED